MVLFVAMLCFLFPTVHANISWDCCEALNEFDHFKVSWDTFLNSRLTDDSSTVTVKKLLASRQEYNNLNISLYQFLSSRNMYDTFMDTLDKIAASRHSYENLKVYLDQFMSSSDKNCERFNQTRKDCASIKEKFPDATDGVYTIKPDDGKPSFSAYCDMTEQGGGWLVIQRRQDGSVDFYRDWMDYSEGFGNLTGEFWLGNEKIHRLTTQKKYELRVDLEDKKGNTVFAEYSNFRVGNMSEFYNLTVDGYSSSSTAGDWLAYNNNRRFSARNLDLDTWSDGDCAQKRHGAWWFGYCSYSHLNGRYNDDSGVDGVFWNSNHYRRSTMKIRPAGDI